MTTKASATDVVRAAQQVFAAAKGREAAEPAVVDEFFDARWIAWLPVVNLITDRVQCLAFGVASWAHRHEFARGATSAPGILPSACCTAHDPLSELSTSQPHPTTAGAENRRDCTSAQTWPSLSEDARDVRAAPPMDPPLLAGCHQRRFPGRGLIHIAVGWRNR